MSQPRKIRTEVDARACLAQANASGLSRVEWARLNAIDARSLYAWRVNLARGAGKAASDDNKTSLRIVELVPKTASAYRLSCGGITLAVPADFDEAVVSGSRSPCRPIA